MENGDKVVIPGFFLNSVEVPGGATQANIQIAGPGNNTIQIQLARVTPTPVFTIQSGDIEIVCDAAVWGS
jgi:hypothetical protein